MCLRTIFLLALGKSGSSGGGIKIRGAKACTGESRAIKFCAANPGYRIYEMMLKSSARRRTDLEKKACKLANAKA